MKSKKELTARKRKELLGILKGRFEKNISRHKGLEWAKVQAKLENNTQKLFSLIVMERTGGEPDVVHYDKQKDEYIFYDCSAETPIGRRNICYDREGQLEREKKGVFPAGNVVDLCEQMGIDLLSEDEYRNLQKIGEFDLKTSSWIKTPNEIRKLGGALFADRRFNNVFVYHNTAPTFYSSRGFRGSIKI